MPALSYFAAFGTLYSYGGHRGMAELDKVAVQMYPGMQAGARRTALLSAVGVQKGGMPALRKIVAA
jgi:hypothetical protein